MKSTQDRSPIDVEYYCPTCDLKFHVYHTTDGANTHCWWCESAVKQTGRVSKIEDGMIVHYLHGKEIGKEPTKRS